MCDRNILAVLLGLGAQRASSSSHRPLKGVFLDIQIFLRKASWLVVGLVVWLVGGLPPCGGGCGRGKGGRAVGWRR